MGRRTLALAILVGLLATSVAAAADLKPIKTQRAKDVTVTLLNESGRWKVGRNDFVLEFTSPDKKPVEVSKATVSTSMPMPGMAPMIAGAKLEPDGPGRYRGTISFLDAGERQVTVSWESTIGRSSTRFNVPVR
jgi:YtkA-like protein